MIGLICWFFDQGSLLHSLLNNSIALQRVLHKTLRYQPPQHSHHNDDRCLLGIISSLLDRVQSPRCSQPRSSYHQRFFWNNFQRNRPVKLHKAKNSGTSSSSSSRYLSSSSSSSSLFTQNQHMHKPWQAIYR